MVDGGGGKVFYGMAGYKAIDPRVEDGSSGCCTCVLGS
jgi:hypothetical protein